MKKNTPKDYPIHPFIEGRWSPRSFENQAISPEQLRSLFEAARWTASSYNAQPWRYVIATQRDQSETFKKILFCLTESNREWAVNAPALAISFVKTTFDDGRENRHALHDVGAANAAISFQATQFGLSTHQMAGIDHAAVREAFDVPNDYEVVVGIAIGFVGNPKRLSPENEKKERAPRVRRTQNEFVFGDEWEDPFRGG